MLQDTITSNQILIPNNQYTFTFDSGETLLIRSSNWVHDNLKRYIQSIGNIISVERPLFSNRFVVRYTPKIKSTLADTLSIFKHAWNGLGYDDARIIEAETGKVSSQPGGVKQLLPEAGAIIGTTAAEILKPVKIFVVLGVVGLIAFAFIQRGK